MLTRRRRMRDYHSVLVLDHHPTFLNINNPITLLNLSLIAHRYTQISTTTNPTIININRI